MAGRSTARALNCGRALVGLAICALAFIACTDGSVDAGADAVRLRLDASLSPEAAAAAAAVQYDSVQAVATDPSGQVVGQNTVPVPAGAQSVEILIDVSLSSPQEVVTVRIRVFSTDLIALEGTSTFPVDSNAGINTSPPVLLLPVAPALLASPTSLQFTSVGGNPVPSNLIVQNVGGGTLTWTASEDASWLTVSPSSGSTDAGGFASIAVSADITGLPEGGQTATLTIDAPGAIDAPTQIPVTLTVNLTPAVGVQPSTLTFATAELADPAPQSLTISNTGGGSLDWSASATSSGGWLALSQTSGTLAGGESVPVSVAVSSSRLAPGTYAGTIQVSAPGASNSQITVAVQLTVTALPRWNLQIGATGQGSGVVRSSPGGIVCTITSGVPSGPCTGVFIQGTVVTLTATPAVGERLNAWGGACSGVGACQVTMAGPTSVTANFGPSPPTLSVNPTSLSYTTSAFSSPPLQTITVSNIGGGTLAWSAQGTAQWLTTVPSSGALGAGQSITVDVVVTSDTLSAGTRQAQVLVVDAMNPNVLIPVAVTLTLTPGSVAPPDATIEPPRPVARPDSAHGRPEAR